jgi:perosamine synthetase
MIPVNEPLLNGNENKYLQECIRTGWIGSEGPFVKQFEDQFAELHGRKYAVAVCNGSAALEAAVLALGLKEGDEVIMPAFTIISCAAAIVKAGAKPVLVDADPLHWNMKVEDVEAKITERTKAIMAVHIYGLPCDMIALSELAEKHGLKIIEDAAEAHGIRCGEKLCGSFGDFSVFSFYPNKLITTGEGGMLLTDNEELAEKCRSLRNLCFQAEKRFVHEEIGSNFRMTNLQAAVGLAQLERWNEFVQIKKRIGKNYSNLLSDVKGIQLPQEKNKLSENHYWVYGIVLEEETGLTADIFMKELGKKGIGTRPFFYPMHLQPVFKKMGLFKGESYPESGKLYKYGFYLPSGMALTEQQQEEVASVLKQTLQQTA